MNAKLNVGLIGFGLSGRSFHAPLLAAHPGYEIRMVVTSKSQDARSLLPDVEVVSHPSLLFQSQNLDLIINCSPNEFHASYTEAALRAGQHVVVEKPFVNTLAEGRRILELAARQGKMVTVFHNRRWDSDFLTVQRLLASGELGDVVHFESHMDRWRPRFRPERWREQTRAGSGLLFDLGPHLLDQALRLFGKPEKITADVQIQKENGQTDDYFHITLHYGRKRVLLRSSSFASVTPRFQIFGDRANFVKGGVDPQEEQLRSGMDPRAPSFGREPETFFGRLTDPGTGESRVIPSVKGDYMAFYEQLHRALTATTAATPAPWPQPPVDPRDALFVMHLIELARLSSREGKTFDVPTDSAALSSPSES